MAYAPRHIASRAQEEKWAAENCQLTKILGWSMIAVFCFSIVSAFFTDRAHIDILMLIGGIAIRKGSQAWIRFYCFISILLVIGGSANIAINTIRQEPFELHNQWVDHHDLTFWYEYIGPIGMLMGLASLCLVTLKARKLVFWTKSAKQWGGTFIAIILIFVAVGFTYPLFKQPNRKETKALIGNELDALRHYAKTSGTTYSTSTMNPAIQLLKQNPTVLKVDFCSSPNSSMNFYTAASTSPNDNWDYEEFVKGPTGEWIQFRVWLQN